MTAIDTPRPVRPGEELDLERLAPYLRGVLGAPGDAEVAVQQFPGGHSNLTYLVTVGGDAYVLRRPPFGTQVKTAHDMEREHALLSRLAPVCERAPRPVHLCLDESILGAKFYLMERRQGVVVRRTPPRGVDFPPALARGLAGAAADALADLHAIDIEATGLVALGHPDGYVRRQVEGWTKRYLAAKTDDIPAVEAVAAWLSGHMPTSGAPTLLHNDFKYDNLVLAPDDLTRITAILDWEMATVGDPLMDFGTALCYWVQADDPPELQAFAFGPTHAPGSYTRAEFAEHYARRTGRSLDAIPFYYAFGLFKTAVVAQQIYLRFARGHTQDPRFAVMIEAVRVLAAQAERATASKHL
ncbi:phosphotransferase family protein [Nannocystis pusilla]|uniref:phosphotransferase family protein n=1 Tax=Nannocystis pusilla TaxID=889268 RepID=UPI003DA586D4